MDLLDPSNDFLKYRLVATGASGASSSWLTIDDFVPSIVSVTDPKILSFSNTLPNAETIREIDTFAFTTGFTNYLHFDQEVFDLASEDFTVSNGEIVSVNSLGSGNSDYTIVVKASNFSLSTDNASVLNAGLTLDLREDAVTNADGEGNYEFNHSLNFIIHNPFNGFDTLYESAPSFGDVDGDGDLDMLSGQRYGKFIYYRNNSDGSFTGYWNVAANPFNGFEVGDDSAPSFGDVDGDGDLDMLSGERYGKFIYYSNDGDGSFTAYGNVAANPFSSFDVGYYSTPNFGDVDGDGDLDMLSGQRYGKFIYYKNVSGTFVKIE